MKILKFTATLLLTLNLLFLALWYWEELFPRQDGAQVSILPTEGQGQDSPAMEKGFSRLRFALFEPAPPSVAEAPPSPKAAPIVEPAKPPPRRGEYKLLGSLVDSEGRQMYLIKKIATNQILSLQAGTTENGLSLKVVNEKTLHLDVNGEMHEISP